MRNLTSEKTKDPYYHHTTHTPAALLRAYGSINTIQSDLLLHLEKWRTYQQYRASTNTAALRKIKESILGANQTKNDFVSHSLIKLIEGDHAPYANVFKKIWQAIIQYSGQARDLARRIFMELVEESGDVRTVFSKSTNKFNR
jgi:hypothetical protein